MGNESEISKANFLKLAETAGLDIDSAHIDNLYDYFLKGVLPGLNTIRELDLGDWEPATLFVLPTVE